MSASAVAPDFRILQNVKPGDQITVRFKGDDASAEASAVLNLVYSGVLHASLQDHRQLQLVAAGGWQSSRFQNRRVALLVDKFWNRAEFERTMRPHIDSLGIRPL